MSLLEGPFIPPHSGGNAKQLVILLHGYGANGTDLLSMGEEWKEILPDAAFVSPNAPEPCEAWPVGFQWFPIRAQEGIVTKEIDRKELIKPPAEILNRFIDEQLAHWGVDESSLAVAGFSQGAMMAMYTMPRRKKPCAGIVAYSGMLIDKEGLKSPDIVKMPVLIVHGDADHVVSPECLGRARNGFEHAGFDVETVLRAGLSHGIDQFGLMRGVEFIREQFEIAEKSGKKSISA